MKASHRSASRNRFSRYALLGLIAVWLLPRAGPVVRAQGQSPLVLTLDEAIARGLEASHRLAEIEARREAASAVTDAREADARPVVSAQGRYTRTNHVDEFAVPSPTGQVRVLYPDVPDNAYTRLDLQWPIYTSGRTDALAAAARAETSALGEDGAAARADLRLEITRAYWAVVTAQATVDVLEQALTRMEAHLTDVRNRLEVGLLPPNDLLSAQAQRSRQEMRLIEARSQLAMSRDDLRRLTGLQVGAVFEVDELLPPPGPVTAGDGAVEEARAERPERRALEWRASAADAREKAANAAARPSLFVNGGYDYGRPNPRIFPREATWQPSWDVSVTVSWTLWDGGRTRAQASEAAATRRAVAERLLEFDEQLTSEVRQRQLAFEATMAALGAAEDAVRAAADARRVVADRFAAGVATSTDQVDAQLALMQAELDRTRTIAGARLAEARLARALGR